MPCQAQKSSGSRTSSRLSLTTAAAVEAALVVAADRAASRIVLLHDVTSCQRRGHGRKCLYLCRKLQYSVVCGQIRLAQLPFRTICYTSAHL
jgi:hypothetical protein